MKTLTRAEVKAAFRAVVEKYGKPTGGEIHCEDQLIAAIAHDLCCYDETHITFEYGKFEVSPSVSIVSKYAEDHTFIGTVKADEWYTPEQRRAMHEIGFGFQF